MIKYTYNTTTHNFNTLNEFIGFGNPEAPIVFMGLEEGADELTIGANYRYRFTRKVNCADVRAFHQHSGITSLSKWFVHGGKRQRTWGNCCKFLIELEGVKVSELEYQMNHLGKLDGTNALIELYPFPRPNHKFWDSILMNMPSFKSLASYYSCNPNSTRLKLIQSATIKSNTAKTIIVHGSIQQDVQVVSRVKNEYHPILNAFGLTNRHTIHSLGTKSNGDVIYAIEYHSGVHRIFFTPFWGNGAMTNEALYNLVDIVKGDVQL